MKYTLVALALLASSVASAATGLQNGSFETNSVGAGDYRYAADAASFLVPVSADPATGWNFSSTAGVSENATAWTNLPAQDGTAYAFLQAFGSARGSISQQINLTNAVSALDLSFYSAGRNGYGNLAVDVYLDSTLLGSVTPASTTGWTAYTFVAGPLAAGAYTLTFKGGTASAFDSGAFIDNVSLRTVAAVPEADSLALAAAGLFVVGALSRRRVPR